MSFVVLMIVWVLTFDFGGVFVTLLYVLITCTLRVWLFDDLLLLMF